MHDFPEALALIDNLMEKSLWNINVLSVVIFEDYVFRPYFLSFGVEIGPAKDVRQFPHIPGKRMVRQYFQSLRREALLFLKTRRHISKEFLYKQGNIFPSFSKRSDLHWTPE